LAAALRLRQQLTGRRVALILSGGNASRAAGQSDAAAATLAQALERYERKNNLAMTAQVRDRLAELPRRSAAMSVPVAPARSCKLALVIERGSLARPSRPPTEEAAILVTV
jgi:hypothetical protein